jgi:hypothetical protein
MRRHIASLIILTVICILAATPALAQSPESIWLIASTTSFKTGETVIVTIHAESSTPIQGFTFQIRYDPACLKPLNAASPIPGMNGLLLPQSPGLADASFASTTPQAVSGALAEVRFTALGGCQTALILESAALAIRNESGFAAPLPGVTVGENTISIFIDPAPGEASDQPLVGPGLDLGVGDNSRSLQLPTGTIIVLVILGLFLVFGVFILVRILRGESDR